MDKTHPCLIFSRNMVEARKGSNHNKAKIVEDRDLAAEQMQIAGLRLLMKKVKKMANEKHNNIKKSSV